MARYPSDDNWVVRGLRFANLLDDQDNKLSPVKFNLWVANASGLLTLATAAAEVIFTHTLNGAGQLAEVVAPYVLGSHALHQTDKRFNQGGK